MTSPYEREDAARRVWARVQLEQLGITAVLRPDGSLLVSATGFEQMRALARYPAAGDAPSAVYGIPVHKAPDWTFSPVDVAAARAIAIARRPFVKTARDLARHLAP